MNEIKIKKILSILVICSCFFASFISGEEEKIKRQSEMFRVATQIFEEQRWEDAIKAFRGVLKSKPTREMAAEASYRIGECYYNLDRFDKAIEIFSEIIKKYKDLYLAPEAYFALGMSYLAKQDYKKAEELLMGKMIESFPAYRGSEKMLDGIGILKFAQGDYTAAAERFQGLKTKEAMFYLAKCYTHMEKPLDAVDIYKKLIENYPNSVLSEMSFYSMGDALFYSRDYPGALYKYEVFLSRYPNTKLKEYARYKLGSCYFAEKSYEKAVEMFQPEVKNRDPYLAAHNYFMLGETYFAKGRMDKALVAYQRARSNYPTARVAALAGLKLGKTYAARGDTLQAQIVYEQLSNLYTTGDFAGLGNYLAGAILSSQWKFAEAAQHFEVILSKYEKSLLKEAALAMSMMVQNEQANWDKTVSLGASVVKKEPDNKSPWRGRAVFYLAEAYYYKKHFPEAKKLYETVRDGYYDPDLIPKAEAGIGWCLLQEGKYEDAIQEYQKVEIGYPIDTTAIVSAKFGKGIAYYNLTEYLKALDEFETLERDYPHAEVAGNSLFFAGLCYYRLEYYAQALRSWEGVLDKYRSNVKAPEAAMQIGETYFRALDYDKAISSYRLILEQYSSSSQAREAQLAIANCYYNSKRDDDAIREYQKFRELYPSDSLAKDALKGIQASYYRKGQKHPEVLREFVEKFSETDLAAEAQFSLAQKEFQDKDYGRAILDFRKVVVDFPKSQFAPQAQAAIVECYRLRSEYQQEAEAAEKFLQYFPNDKQAPDVAFALGAAYYNLVDYKRAADAFKLILDKYSSSSHVAPASTNLALCYRKLGRPQDAISTLQNFVSRFPNDPKVTNAAIQIGVIYEEQGQHDKAIASLSTINPPTGEAACEVYSRLGDAYRNAKKIEEAMATYAKVKKYGIMDNNFKLSALAQLALLQERAMKNKEAAETYQLIIDSTNRPEVKQAAMKKLSTLRGGKG